MAGAAAAVAAAMTGLSPAADAAVVDTSAPAATERAAAVEPPPYPPSVGSLRMVSYRWSGLPASLQSTAEDLSHDGRQLAFTSLDDKILPGTDARGQLYLRDLASGATRLVSRGPQGEPGNSYTERASMSADGTRIAFESTATNLVPGAAPGYQVYLYDATSGTIALMSRAPDGEPGNGDSRDPDISADGTHVVFQSRADNLDPAAAPRSGHRQVYVAEVGGGPVRMVTEGAGGRPADEDSFEPSISADGRLIAFRSEASDLPAGEGDSDDDIFVVDVAERSMTQVSRSPTDRTGVSLEAEISDDGRHVVFVSTLNGLAPGPTRDSEFHVYVRDLASGGVERVTRAADGGLVDPRQGDQHPTISSDGSLIAYESEATNLMPDQQDDNGFVDTFVYDRTTGTTTLVSRTRSGDTPNAGSGSAVLSGDGSYVAFGSGARDLSNRDRDRSYDIFVRRLS